MCATTEEEKHGGNPRASSPPRDTSIRLFPSARLFSQVMARRYGHLELLLTLNNFPGLSASAGESEIISGWNFLYFTRPDRVDVQQRN